MSGMLGSSIKPVQPPEGLLENIRRVRVETPDLDGTLRGKLIDADKFRPARSCVTMTEAYLSLTVADEVAPGGIGSPETGYGDMLLWPDWSTACRIPNTRGVLSVLCDGRTKDGSDHAVHPRSVLKRVVDDFTSEGLQAKFGIELEFRLFRLDERTTASLEHGELSGLSSVSRLSHSYSLARWTDCADFFDDLIEAAGVLGVAIESVLTEGGRGMYEAALAPSDPVGAADAVARFKLVAREVAAKHNLLVSFIAKLSHGEAGSSGHVHQSVLRDGENILWGGQQGILSQTGYQYLAGLLEAVRQCGVLMAPFPNSYRRFDRAFFAPDSASWAYDNRHACVRCITTDARSVRLELRRPGADLQPYLTIAISLAGGLAGIRRGLTPPAESSGSCDPVSGSELAANLGDAIADFDQSELAREALGDGLVDSYVALRAEEMRRWATLNAEHIPDWELKRYLEVV
jgi:glutamine synthetase